MNQNSELPVKRLHSQSTSIANSHPLSSEREELNTGENIPFDEGGGEEGFDIRRLFALIRRRRKVMAATVGTMLGLAIIYIIVAPKVYMASIDLLVNSSKSSSSAIANQLPMLGDLLQATGTRTQDTEVEILKSDSVQDAAVGLLPKALQPGARKKMMVLVDPKRSTDVITVSVQSRDPKLAVVFSNAIGQAYQTQNQLYSTEQYSDTAQYVSRQLDRVNKALAQKRRELREFKEKNDVVDLSAQTTAEVTRLGQLQADLQDTEAQINSNTNQLRNLRAQVAKMAPDEVKPDTIVTSPVVGQLRTELTSLETQRLAAQKEYAPGSPEVQAFDSQIAALRQRLQGEARTEVGISKRVENPLRAAALLNIAQAQSNIWSAQARIGALQQNIDNIQQSVRKLPQREYVLSQLEGDVATYQQTFLALSGQYQTLLINQNSPVSNARIISHSPASRVSPRTISTILLALLGGILLAFLAALTADTLDNRIHTEEDAVQVTGLPILTHVPLIKQGSDTRILIDADTPSPILESFRMLRTQLALIATYGHMKTLMVTSSQPHEGKSTVASNLAIALALNGSRVIIVDADLRRPRVHSQFGLSRTKGLTTIVGGLCTIEEALQPTPVEGLQVLAAGATPPNPTELLDARPTRDIIKQLQAMADYVIIDAPPALVMADAQIVSTLADGVLFVVSCQDAHRGAVERTAKMMAQSNMKVVGMVLNKFTIEQGGYYGYATYGAYHATYKGPQLEGGKDDDND